MALRQDESDRINEQVDSLLDRTKKRDNPFTIVKNAEENGTIDNQTNLNTDNLKEAEENTTQAKQSDWVNNVAGKERGSKSKSKGTLKFLKKKGPLTAIISIVVGGGFGLSMFFSPGLLLVQIKEMMVNKFNTQLTSMDVRTTKILSKKMGTTSGLCGSIVTIKCKYSTMSEKQLNNFKKAGIEVIADEEKSLFGRTKPKSYIFEGKTINAASFSAEMSTNSSFRSALKVAYNPKFGGFTDSFWKKAASSLRIKKAAPVFEGDDYESKLTQLEESMKEATSIKKSPKLGPDAIDPETNLIYTESGLTDANERIDRFNELVEQAGTGTGSGVSSKILNGVTEIENMIKLTGPIEHACTVYRTFRAVGYAAKAARTIQLASYAMLFLNVADQIKAGTAKPDDVSFLGTILTNESTNDLGVGESATDSFGYKYAAYGETGNMPTSAMQYMAAASLSGIMVNFFNNFPSGIKNTCKFLGNPIVGFVSLIGGSFLAFISGGASTATLNGVKIALKTAAKSPATWAVLGITLGEVFLPNLLKDIVAGNLIDKYTVGAYAGDAITSGASGIMGTSAKFGGNAPLTPDQAVAYNSLSNNIIAKYAEEDRLTYSPFDASNKNTFMGSIILNLTPYLSKMSSITGTLSSITSLSLNSFSFLSPKITKAASSSDYAQCQDIEYRDLNLATDPYCNVVYGIPVEYLNTDPIAIADRMIQNNQINAESGEAEPGSEYSNFLTNCINRVDPLGDNTTSSTGSECVLNNNTNQNYKDYYIYYIDQRVEKGMEAY